MNITDPKVIIQYGQDMFIYIWIIEERLTGFINYRIDEQGFMIKEEIENKDELTAKPFLKLPRMLADLFFKSITDYQEKKGIKTKDENLIEGKLQATEAHLKDMQEISRKLLDAYLTPKEEINYKDGFKD
jgi:hypothetical protein